MAKTTTTSFLGTPTTDPRRALPDIEDLDITVTQDPYGTYFKNEWQRSSHYTLATVERHVRCANPRCQQGGLDLQNIISSWPDGVHKFSCNGHEGSPAGRRKGDPCENSFTVALQVKRKPGRGAPG